MRRWLVERFFAWLQWQRRILIRWEHHAHKSIGIFGALPGFAPDETTTACVG
jgi:transposase